MLKVRIDGRFEKAMKSLLAEAIEAQTVAVGKSVVYFIMPDPLGFIEERLDECLPGWRNDTAQHWNLQGPGFTAPLRLLRVRHLALRALGHEEPAYGRVEVPPRPPKPAATIASLYGVPNAWLCQIPLIDLQTPEPTPYYEGPAPSERHQRRPERVLQDGVRCGKCGDHIESADKARHAQTRHQTSVSEIAWTKISRFRRA